MADKPRALVTFPAETIASLRARAASAVSFSEEGPEGWSRSKADPAKIVRVFRTLRVKDQFQLRGYEFRIGSNGNGVVHALPRGEFPHPRDCEPDENTALRVPVPRHAIPFTMDAIEGDGSPLSYLSASLLFREFYEWGAIWHGRSWSDEAIIASDPRRRGQMTGPDWFWRSGPVIWRPGVSYFDPYVIASFVTTTDVGQYRVIHHRDRYLRGRYVASFMREIIAEGPRGIIY